MKWSKDGGTTFVNKVSMDQNLTLGNGLSVNFSSIDGSVLQVRDSWKIIGKPLHQVVAGQLRNQDKLIVSGPFTGSTTTTYYIEIDGDRTLRWSKDGGITFVNEKVSMDQNLTLGNGLSVNFSGIDNSIIQVGDSWEIIGNPLNTIVTIFDAPAAVLSTRNALEYAFNEARLRGQLEFRTESRGTEDKLYLYSTLSLPYLSDDDGDIMGVNISGTALKQEDGSITFTENTDNVIRRQNSFGRVLSFWDDMEACITRNLQCFCRSSGCSDGQSGCK